MASTLQSYITNLKQQYGQEDLPEYELQRKRIQQQLEQQAQAERDALQRSFARLGGGPAGAQIKLQTQLEQGLGERRQQAEEQVSASELAMRRQLAETEKQRQFARGEREAGQMFARGEREAGQAFASGERLAGQTFAERQLAAQQAYARGEREAGQSFASQERSAQQEFARQQAAIDQAFKDKIFSFESNSKLKEMDLAERQFKVDQDIAEFNKQLAQMEANKPTDLFGSLFGPWASTSFGQQGGLLAGVGNIISGKRKLF